MMHMLWLYFLKIGTRKTRILSLPKRGDKRVIELNLVKPNKIYINQYLNLTEECKIDIEKCGMTYLIPIYDRDKILLEIHC